MPLSNLKLDTFETILKRDFFSQFRLPTHILPCGRTNISLVLSKLSKSTIVSDKENKQQILSWHFYCKQKGKDISPIAYWCWGDARWRGGDEDIGHVTGGTNVETAFYIAPDHLMPRIKSQIISFWHQPSCWFKPS